MKMPTMPTFGDKRPQEAAMPTMPPAPAKDMKPMRKLLPDAKPMPEIQTYRQTNGPLYLARLHYNGVWISGTGQNEADAVFQMEQFYMRETAQGQKDSVKVVE